MSFWRDESGSVMVEISATVLLFFTLIGGVVDGSMLYYQWNAATKAVQQGARLAAVSGPVAAELNNITGGEGGLLPGSVMPSAAFDATCTSSTATGSAGTCTCTGASCPSPINYSAANMRAIIFGRCATGESPCPRTACVTPDVSHSIRNIGMCNYFPSIDARKVSIRYQYTGLGYVSRPTGPVPTITVSIRDLTFNYVFLQPLIGKAPVNLPGFRTTVTGEDLRQSGS